MRQARRMLGEPSKLWVRAGAGKDPSIAFGNRAPALTLERSRNNNRPAARGTRVDDLVDEIDEVVWKTYGDLLAHPKMVSIWEQGGQPSSARIA
jgi:hypothetical protein